MKVLFAVNNDEISNAIVKKYQKEYKEILSYKNVYYFNAILKELQKDKTYDRVVISEDLEPFANNNYDAIDKFLFDKLDNISDEATDVEGNDTDIILICTDRRSKSDEMLTKFFGIGIYSAIVGQDRSIDQVCKLISKPRTKKEAKIYYKIEAEAVNYQSENEESVSETEVQNILAHYKRLGRNEDKYVESFNNIVSQYTDAQLKIIIQYLPISVKAVLEEKSPKYQQLVSFGKAASARTQLNEQYAQNIGAQKKKEETIKVKMLDKESSKSKMDAPVVIPSNVSTAKVKRLIKQEKPKPQPEPQIEEEIEETFDILGIDEINEVIEQPIIEKTMEETVVEQEVAEQPKRGRGRPRKIVSESEQNNDKPKRGRGRPRKNPIVEEQEENEETEELIDLFDLDDEKEQTIETKDDTIEEEVDLFSLDNEEQEEDEEIDLFNLDDELEDTVSDINEEDEELNLFESDDDDTQIQQNEEVNLFELDEDEEQTTYNVRSNEIELPHSNEEYENSYNTQQDINAISKPQYRSMNSDYNTLLTKDKKVISFVGTTKNGTSFIVNNAAHMLASMGISTAILDMTKTRNAYYIYTNSEEQKMKTAKNCIYKLRSGIAEGVVINKNLTVYTSVPEDDENYDDVEAILSTLVKNYSVVLIDCDFDTPVEYFAAAQEIFLVQSMDVLTIQPLTAFLRNLQSKGILKQEKIKIVINKGVKIRSVPIRTLIGGISKYNDPSMTYMKDLFDRDKVSYCVVPFEIPNYIKYLDSLITCSITLNGYTKPFIAAIKEVCNMIYPLINKQTYSPRGDKYRDNFSSEMNDTLNRMKKKYQ